jgi:hypothetical protein
MRNEGMRKYFPCMRRPLVIYEFWISLYMREIFFLSVWLAWNCFINMILVCLTISLCCSFTPRHAAYLHAGYQSYPTYEWLISPLYALHPSYV